MKLGSGYAEGEIVEFNLTFEAKDKKVRITFDNVIGIAPGSYDSGARPSNKEEMDKVVSGCLEALKTSIVDSINTSAKKDDW